MILQNNRKLKYRLKRLIEVSTRYLIRYYTPPWNDEMVTITFDDGPLPSTLDVLNELREYKKKAIFFLVAENIKKYPEVSKKIVEEGHLIGLHGYTHTDMKKLKLSEFSSKIKEGLGVIKEICGVETKYFRPPFGRINLSQTLWLLTHGFTLFFWSCGVSEDGEFDFINPEIEKINNTNKNRFIVLLHDYLSLSIIRDVLKKF